MRERESKTKRGCECKRERVRQREEGSAREVDRQIDLMVGCLHESRFVVLHVTEGEYTDER